MSRLRKRSFWPCKAETDPHKHHNKAKGNYRKNNVIKSHALTFLVCAALGTTAVAEEASIASNFTVSDYIASNTSPTPFNPESPSDNPKLRFDCEPSHFLYDDPILNPGAPGTSHLHQFFGNTGTNAHSTFSSLRQNGGGTCSGGPVNRSGYWIPAMYNGQGKLVKPDGIEVYYTTQRDKMSDFSTPGCPNALLACPTTLKVQRWPRGMNFIFGNNVTAQDVDQSPVIWKCEDFSSVNKQQFWHRSNNSLGIQNCPSNQRLIVTIGSSPCWDGTTLTSVDGRHLKKQILDGGSGLACPNGFGTLLGEVQLIIFYSHNGQSDYSQWFLSSDRFNGANHEGGRLMHSDYYPAWDDGTAASGSSGGKKLVFESSIWGLGSSSGDKRETSGGNLGDNTILRNDKLGVNGNETMSYSALAEGDRLVDIPSNNVWRRGRPRIRLR